MGAVLYVVRGDMRRRRVRIAALILLVGATGAVTMAAAAGARRSSTALERFQASSSGADAELSGEVTPEDARVLEQLPGVAAVGYLRVFGVVLPQLPQFQSLGVPADNRFGTVVDRDRIVKGRAPNPNAADEVALGEGVARELGLTAGDTLAAVTYTPQQVDQSSIGADPGPPAGPKLALRVTAIVRRPLDLGEEGSGGSMLVLTPAFAKTYDGRVGEFGTRIRIHAVHGQADVPRILQAARERLGDRLVNAQALNLDEQGATKAIDILTVALWIAAAVAALAGTVAIGIMLSREMTLMVLDLSLLRDLGCTRRERLLVALLAGATVAVAGAFVAFVGAILLSPFFPVGAARRADPDLGVHIDTVVALAGLAAITAIVLIVSFVAGARALIPPAARPAPRLLASRVSRLALTPPVENGVRMAVDPGRGRTAVPVRAGIVGAAAGVVGVTAVLVFAASFNQLVDTPERQGVGWDASMLALPNSGSCGGETYGLKAEAAFTALTEVCTQNIELDRAPMNALALTQLRGSIEPEILRGRAPARPNEVALGAKTMRKLHKNIGDTVEAQVFRHQQYTIVGEAVLPTLGAAQALGEGAIFTGDGYKAIYDPTIYFRYFVVRLAPGTDRDALAARVASIGQLETLKSPSQAIEVARLQRINWLPRSLALLFAVLGSIAVAHALLTTVRRRRRELALLKALGFGPGDVRLSVAATATTLATAGLVIGIPIGGLIGVLIWRRITDNLGVATTGAIPVLALVLTVVAAIAAVNAIAFFPGRRAARTPSARLLQAE